MGWLPSSMARHPDDFDDYDDDGDDDVDDKYNDDDDGEYRIEYSGIASQLHGSPS